MLSNNWVFLKQHSRPVQRFQVLGERSSGTNFVSSLIRLNTSATPTTDYGWKHGFIQFQAVLRNDLLVVVARDPLAWLLSTYRKPWHVPDSMVNVTFSEFLRQPWESVVDMPGSMNATRPKRSRGLPAQLDRHPITGRAFDNPIQLRNAKLAAFLGIANRSCNVCFANYEAVANEPQRFVAELTNNFGLETSLDWKVPQRVLGKMQRHIVGERRDDVIKISDNDRDFMLAESDSGLEASLGYNLELLLAAYNLDHSRLPSAARRSALLR